MLVLLCNCRQKLKFPKLSFFRGAEVKEFSEVCGKEKKKALKLLEGKRAVVAACSPRILEAALKDAKAEVLEFVNVREQALMVGHSEAKVVSSIVAAIEKVKAAEPPMVEFKLMSKDVIVVGGGIAGMEVARQIAGLLPGNRVHLLERTPFLGGVVAKLNCLYPKGMPNSHVLNNLIAELLEKSNVQLYLPAQLISIAGKLGNYEARIKHGPRIEWGCDLCGKCAEVCPQSVDDFGFQRKAIYFQPTYPNSYGIDPVSCTKCGKCAEVCELIGLGEQELMLRGGALVIATGLCLYEPSRLVEYYKSKQVMSHLEFERKIANGFIRPKRVFVVGCAGSRDKKHLNYCSQICCFLALKEAKLVKDICPEAEVHVSYIDMRSYGQLEELYNSLREAHGVKFIHGKPSEILEDGEELVVRVEDTSLGKQIEVRADVVVLSVGFVPDGEVLGMLGLAKDQFPVQQSNSSLSAELGVGGVYFCGCAAHPKIVPETLSEARRVAAEVALLLKQDSVRVDWPVPRISEEVCGGAKCGLCVDACPQQALSFDEDGKLRVDELLCAGCGICSATCPTGSNELALWGRRSLRAQLGKLVNRGDIILFLCKWSSYEAADRAAYLGLSYPEVKVVRIPCTGRLDIELMINTFALGASRILIAGCPPEACHYGLGNFKARKRVIALKKILEAMGIAGNKIRLEWIGKDEARRFVSIVEEMCHAQG